MGLVGDKFLTITAMDPKFQLFIFPNPWQLEPSYMTEACLITGVGNLWPTSKIWSTTCLYK